VLPAVFDANVSKCGIAGIIDKSGKLGPARLGQLAKEATDRMRYRGPDDCGLWVSPDGRCALSHRRLSIIDVSSAGHQPMVSQTGRSVIVFNGEAYNFLELKREQPRYATVCADSSVASEV
jgi:asparagine synthase (glutamine-hydrolysing)